MGKNVDRLGENLARYRQVLESLTHDDPPKSRGHCQICGAPSVFMRANRSWFPLAGSADSDPCTLPGLAGKTVCADCFRAVVLLPLSCLLCKGGAYLYHVSDPQLQVEASRETFRRINALLLVAREGGVGATNASLRAETTLSGRLELLEIVSGSTLWDHTNPEGLSSIPRDGATVLSFRNGDPPSTSQLHLPAQALEFLDALIRSGQVGTFLRWARDSKSLFFDGICDEVESRRSLAPTLRELVRKRSQKPQRLTKEELEVLQIYEDIALRRKERFDALERIARAVNELKPINRDSFVKQIAGMRSKERFCQLLTELKRRDDLAISRADLRTIFESFETESISLLYLICTADR
jgi:hypothetical protein